MRSILLIMALLVLQLAKAQLIVEGLAGNDHLFYQHLLAKKFSSKSVLGVMHIANVSSRYDADVKKAGRPNEIMNQAYITTKLNKSFTLLAGMFYSNASGIRASAAIQYALPFKNGLWVMVPRVDIEHRGSVEMMSMFEYQPMIAKTIKLYTRLQLMSNYGPYQHNRSYQRLRLGVTIKGTQVGVGVNLDEYGKQSKPNLNAGLFIRKEII